MMAPRSHADMNSSCGVALYANATSFKCKQCEKRVALRINPKLVGLLVDETGAILAGKLIWSDLAWEQLLGRTPKELVAMSKELLQYLEHRLLFLRIIVLFGWSTEVGKIVLLKVLSL